MSVTATAGRLETPPLTFVETTATIWTITTATTIIAALRFFIRYRLVGRFLWDDLAYLLATLCMIASTGVEQVFLHDSHALLSMMERHVDFRKNKPVFDAMLDRDQKLRLAGIYLLIICTWLVKATFMFVYRTVFGVDRIFMKIWWATCVLLVVSFLACVFLVIFICGEPAAATSLRRFGSSTCYNQELAVAKAVCALNVFTDLLIILLPWKALIKLQARPIEKIIIGAVFSFGFLIIGMDIARTVQSLSTHNSFTSIMILFVAEVCVAVIVGAVPVYWNLFDLEKRRRVAKGRYTSEYSVDRSRRTHLGGSADDEEVIIQQRRSFCLERSETGERIDWGAGAVEAKGKARSWATADADLAMEELSESSTPKKH